MVITFVSASVISIVAVFLTLSGLIGVDTELFLHCITSALYALDIDYAINCRKNKK